MYFAALAAAVALPAQAKRTIELYGFSPDGSFAAAILHGDGAEGSGQPWARLLLVSTESGDRVGDDDPEIQIADDGKPEALEEKAVAAMKKAALEKAKALGFDKFVPGEKAKDVKVAFKELSDICDQDTSLKWTEVAVLKKGKELRKSNECSAKKPRLVGAFAHKAGVVALVEYEKAGPEGGVQAFEVLTALSE